LCAYELLLLIASRVVAFLLYFPFGIEPFQWLCVQLNGLFAQPGDFVGPLTSHLRETYSDYKAILGFCHNLFVTRFDGKKLLLAFDEMNMLANRHRGKFVRPSEKYGVDVNFSKPNRKGVADIGEHDSLRSLSG
jgi:hypothetical protein